MTFSIIDTKIARFFALFLLSAFGYEFIFFIMTIFIYQTSHNAIYVGIFSAITFLPKFLSPLFGIAGDRHNKSAALAITAAVISVLLSLMLFFSDIIALLVLWFFVSAGLSLIANLRITMMNDVLSRKKYTAGNSIILIITNTARICSPILGGLAMAWTNKSFLLIFIGAVYLTIAALSLTINLEKNKSAITKTNLTNSWKQGADYIRQDPDLFYLTVLSFSWRLFLGLQIPLFVVLVQQQMKGNDVEYGIFMTIVGIGSIAGSFLGLLSGKNDSLRKKIMTFGLPVHYLFFALLGFISTLWVGLLIGFIGFAVFYATLVQLHSLRDYRAAAEKRGQIYGTVTAITTLPAIVSILCGGFLADALGVGAVIAGAGFLSCLAYIIIFIVFRKRRKEAAARIIAAA